MRVRKVDSDAIKLYEVKVKFFAPRQIQRRLLAALVTLSRKVFRPRGIITRGFTWGCRRGRKRSSGRFSPAGSALTGAIMRSVGDAPLIERISSAMMWSRGHDAGRKACVHL